MQNSSYNIYNASAGSGKTYTLAKSYLKIILAGDSTANYREILAITFTNKAVNEMKERILGSLFEFGNVKDIKNAPPMFLSISEELKIEGATLQKRAKITLKKILHNYAFFDVSTIDKFTHRLIRTFAKDLKLPQNFEVILDTDLVLSEAVARLVNKAGTDKELTKVLIEFALEKADDDKSWDVSLDIFDMGKELLFKEKHEHHLENLIHKELSDFNDLKNHLKKKIKVAEETLKNMASEALELIASNGLEFSDFRSSYFPKFMADVKVLKSTVNFNAAWKQDFENTSLYTKTCPEDKKASIDGLHSSLNTSFQSIKETFFNLSFLKNAYKNIVPFTVLNALKKEVKNIELERDEIPLSTFNSIISKEIKNQPVPFIYERLGEKYRHYFIDEFQDTSELQWTNLIPLIGNAIESKDEVGNSGSLLLVGDAKQAIYRWRGGKAEQFLDLVNKQKNPFFIEPNVENLPSNYRSYEEVIKFNNDFFTTLNGQLNNTTYSKLFEEGNQQLYNHKKGGFVQLTFIEEEDKNGNELYCNEVLQSIRSIEENKHPLSDICILVRNKKDGVLLADFLTENDIPIISSETLLLKSNTKVNFLINLIKYSTTPEDLDIAYQILYFLNGDNEQHLHSYVNKHLRSLEKHLLNDFNFSIAKLKQQSVFDGFEQAIKSFDLIKDSDAYVTYLLDEVIDVEHKQGVSTSLFIEYWEKKRDKLSISAPLSMNAVQIMTVHKSKGLEFPVVIFPFADSYIYKDIKPKMWLPINKEEYNDYSEVLINKNKEVINYSEYAEALFEDEQQKLELDSFNVLYVALTRAVKALYIISKKDIDAKSNPKTDYYSGLFIKYLIDKGMWQADKLNYEFGAFSINDKIKAQSNTQETIPFQYSYKERSSFNIVTTAGTLWETTTEAAINKGNTIHQILSLIETKDDVEGCFKKLINNGSLNEEEAATLKIKILSIIEHPKLQELYTKDMIIKNETDIITKNGIILRPDRIVFDGNNATIIDYKTGQRNIAYKDQIDSYANALEEMNYHVNGKIIIYINDVITPEFI
ncbi:UvrD-helicase domain-containing protein [Cellulophaga sp. HaHaR_3_176]|uniref:UvrD-helicase domain-containing protein n=1 Tax=Cellulophaga sp. HaHaR_3_176 TaxID=1942464 RepID=UPI001C1FC4A6|nr:UvrD-helicase domain-containing protein [Cellulophaga sp. HaHaR_3_176]QWX83466.1 UvrD-helicase domain-containing protein [Cellulophaga sp. HaHaR_3_176]